MSLAYLQFSYFNLHLLALLLLLIPSGKWALYGIGYSALLENKDGQICFARIIQGLMCFTVFKSMKFFWSRLTRCYEPVAGTVFYGGGGPFISMHSVDTLEQSLSSHWLGKSKFVLSSIIYMSVADLMSFIHCGIVSTLPGARIGCGEAPNCHSNGMQGLYKACCSLLEVISECITCRVMNNCIDLCLHCSTVDSLCCGGLVYWFLGTFGTVFQWGKHAVISTWLQWKFQIRWGQKHYAALELSWSSCPVVSKKRYASLTN